MQPLPLLLLLLLLYHPLYEMKRMRRMLTMKRRRRRRSRRKALLPEAQLGQPLSRKPPPPLWPGTPACQARLLSYKPPPPARTLAPDRRPPERDCP